MSNQVDLLKCAHCGGWIPPEATMCAHCGTSDVRGDRARATAGSAGPVRRAPPTDGMSVTRMIIWANVAFLLFSLFIQFKITGGGNALRMLVTFDGLAGAFGPCGAYRHAEVVRDGEWWRAISACYLHAGLIHIGMNMWVFKDLGRVVEDLVGPWRLIVIYFVSGVGSTVAISIWHAGVMDQPNVAMVGASGAIFGVIGALTTFALRQGTSRGRMVGMSLMRNIGFLLLVGFLVPMISNTGHVGGLIPGAIIGLLIGERFGDRMRPRGAGLWRSAAFLCIGVTVVALANAVRHAINSPGVF